MSDTNVFISNSKDTFISDITSSLWGLVKSKIKNTNLYLSSTKNINFESANKEFKLLIEDSFHEAMNGFEIDFNKQSVFRECILENADILLDWFRNDPYPSFDENKIYISNYEIKEQLLRLFKSLHYQMELKRDVYTSSALYQLKAAISTESNKIIAKEDLILQELSTLKSFMAPSLISNNWKISDPLNKAEKLLKERQYNSAKLLLDTLSESLSIVTIEEREKYYEIYTNILLANQENQEAAIPLLKKLIENTSIDAKKNIRNIWLLCLEKKYSEVLQQIENELKNNPSDTTGLYELKLNVLLLENKLSAANDYIESIKDSFSKYVIWKTRILTCLGNYNEAEDIINKHTPLFSKDFDLQVLALQTKVFNMTDNFSKNGFDPSWKSNLQPLISKAKELLEIVHENKQDKETLLISLAFLYRVANETEEVLNYYKQLESLNSKNPNFLRNYPLILVQTGKQKESISWFLQYTNEYPEDLFILDIYYQVLTDINVKEAIKGMELLPLEDKYIQIKTRLISAYVKNHEKHKARDFWNLLNNSFPDNLFVLTAQIDFLIDDQKIEEASSLAKQIFNNTNDDLSKFIIMHRIIGIDVNYNLSQLYLDDISLLDSFSNNYEMLLHFREQYLGLLLTTNQIQKAYLTIKKIREYELLTPNIIRNEIFCNFNTQNYQQVLILFEELQTYENLNSQDNLVYLRACYALGDTKTFKEKIDSIPDPNNEYDFSLLHNQLFKLGLKEKDIEFAHKGYKKFPKNLKLQENFIDAVLGSAFNSLPEEIKTDAIICRDNYFSTNAPNKRYQQFILPENPTPEDIYKILNQIYPSPQPINYQKLINDNYIHISLLTINQFNYFDLWESVRNIREIPIYYNKSNYTLLNREIFNSKTNKVFIDLPSLVTCAFIDILHLLPKIFDKIYISQRSIQEIENLFASQNNPYLSTFTSCFYKLNNYKTSKTPINSQITIELASKIKEFSRLSCVEIVGKQLCPIKVFPSNYESHNRFIEFESLKYAYETEIPIMIENWYFKELLSIDKDAPPYFSIDSVLSRLSVERHLSDISYVRCLCKLLELDYRWVFINHFSMFYVIRYYGYLESKESEIIFSRLSDKSIYNPRWTLEQLSILMAKIWNTPIPIERKAFWSNKIFEIYAKRNDIPFGLINLWLKAMYNAIKTNQNKQYFLDYINSFYNNV